VETIAAQCEVGSALISLNVDVPQYKGERPQDYRRANDEARDRIELGRRLMSFSPMSHNCFPLILKFRGKGWRFHDISVPKERDAVMI
jgi:hypothetical protein